MNEETYQDLHSYKQYIQSKIPTSWSIKILVQQTCLLLKSVSGLVATLADKQNLLQQNGLQVGSTMTGYVQQLLWCHLTHHFSVPINQISIIGKYG